MCAIFTVLWVLEVFITIIPFGLLLYVFPLAILSPVYLVHKKTWYKIERKLYSILPWIFLSYPHRRNYSVNAYGDVKKLQKICQQSRNELGLVIANHQTPSDIAVLIHFWHRINPKASHFSDLTWIQDYLLSVIPTGWVSKIHGDFFVLQTQDINPLTKCTQCTTDTEKIKDSQPIKMRRYVSKIMKRHRFLQFFPEAGLLCNRKEGSQRFAKKYGFPVLENVALPKTTGFTTVVDELYKNNYLGENSDSKKRALKHLIRLTISYPDIEKPWSPVNMIGSGILFRKRKVAHIHCHVESAENIPKPIDSEFSTTDQLAEKMKEPCEQFLLQQYVEMDKILAQFYQPSEVVSSVTPDSELIKAQPDIGQVYELEVPGCPLYFAYSIAVCSLGIFIAVPVCLALYT